MQVHAKDQSNISDKYNTQVEASIKAKGQLYCCFSITRYLLSGSDWPHHLTICTQRALGSKRVCFNRLLCHLVDQNHALNMCEEYF